MVRFSHAEPPRWREAVGAASGTALAGGVLGGMCALSGLLLPDYLGAGFLALAVGLPGLMLQDSYRFAFFAAAHGAPLSSTTSSGACCRSRR